MQGFTRPKHDEQGETLLHGDIYEDYPYQARDQIHSLVETLETLTKRDPEQEVQGIALPVLDAVIESVQAVLPDKPVVEAVRGVLSPRTDRIGRANPGSGCAPCGEAT